MKTEEIMKILEENKITNVGKKKKKNMNKFSSILKAIGSMFPSRKPVLDKGTMDDKTYNPEVDDYRYDDFCDEIADVEKVNKKR